MLMNKRIKSLPEKENTENFSYAPKSEAPVSAPVVEQEEIKVYTKATLQEEPKKAFSPYTVQINHPALRIRSGPSSEYAPVGIINDMGKYEILAEENGFGKIAEERWIMLSYTIKV